MAPRTDDLLPRSLRGLYARLPAVLLGSVVVCLAVTVPSVFAPGLGPVSCLLYGLLLPPAAGFLVHIGNQLALGDEQTVHASLGAARRSAAAGGLIGSAAALPVASALVALEVWQQSEAVWVLPCLAVAGAFGVVTVLLGLVVLPVVVADPRLPARTLFRLAVVVLAHRPVPVVGCAMLAGMGLWAATHWSASLLLLVPGPVTVVLCAAVWTSALDLGLVTVDRPESQRVSRSAPPPRPATTGR